MVSDLMNKGCADDGEPSIAPESIPTGRSSSVSLLSNPMCSEMSVPVLATHCLRELSNYRRGGPCTDTYAVELLRRATIQGDQEAWAWIQRCLGGMVRSWLRYHPHREAACCLESEENYVAQAFERFWQATASKQLGELSTLTAALQYLYASLHGAILDTLRAYSQPREVPLPQPGELGEPQVEDQSVSLGVWEALRTMLSNNRERRLAYLLYHCGLEPAEIVRYCPQEWSDVQEIARLRHSIFLRLMKRPEW